MQTTYLIKYFNRDYDILVDSLGMESRIFNAESFKPHSSAFVSGAIYSQYFLESSHLVSERLIEKIDRASSAMMESGLHQFSTNLNDFKQEFIDRELEIGEENGFRALTMQQLNRPMILIFCLWAFAMIIFITEKIGFELKTNI